MTKNVAEHILSVIGKDPGSKGIILPAQMPGAIRALEAAIETEREEERQIKKHPPAASADEKDHDDGADAPAVTLGQRAWPFIEMLKDASAADREITWGV